MNVYVYAHTKGFRYSIEEFQDPQMREKYALFIFFAIGLFCLLWSLDAYVLLQMARLNFFFILYLYHVLFTHSVDGSWVSKSCLLPLSANILVAVLTQGKLQYD